MMVSFKWYLVVSSVFVLCGSHMAVFGQQMCTRNQSENCGLCEKQSKTKFLPSFLYHQICWEKTVATILILCTEVNDNTLLMLAATLWLLQARPISSDPFAPWRSVDVPGELTTTLFPECVTLDDLFVRAVKLYANEKCLGTRELLREEDEKQPNGRVFKKVSEYLCKGCQNFIATLLTQREHSSSW